MPTEWEAVFWPINKDTVRAALSSAGAVMVFPERLMRRVNLYLPESVTTPGFARVRDEGHRITLSVKDTSGTRIEDKKEVQVVVDDFDSAQRLLRALSCKDKNYQESTRELWTLDGAEITIDDWPFLEPLCEVEADSEASVRAVAEKLGFDWNTARFCSADKLYAEKYNVPHTAITQGIPRLTFDMPDPFA